MKSENKTNSNDDPVNYSNEEWKTPLRRGISFWLEKQKLNLIGQMSEWKKKKEKLKSFDPKCTDRRALNRWKIWMKIQIQTILSHSHLETDKVNKSNKLTGGFLFSFRSIHFNANSFFISFKKKKKFQTKNFTKKPYLFIHVHVLFYEIFCFICKIHHHLCLFPTGPSYGQSKKRKTIESNTKYETEKYN